MTTLMDNVLEAPDATRYTDPTDFSALLDKEFKPKTDEARDAVEAAVRTLAEQALVNAATMTDDAYSSIEAIIAEIDRKLSEQINLVLHKEDFQKIESAWRGIHHLVYNTETDEKLKIRFMDVSKDEVRRTLRRHKGIAWDQSPIFKRIYEEEYGQLGGEPYGCLVADYYFDHTPPDVELLGAIAKVSAASHAPFIAGSAPSLLGMESWQELANPRDLAKITSNLEHAPWNSLRNTEDSRYVGLAMPRFLARLPYGMKTNPVDEFDFEEETEGADHRNYVWSNAAYAMAVNINRSFKLYGWCTMIRGVESGGILRNQAQLQLDRIMGLMAMQVSEPCKRGVEGRYPLAAVTQDASIEDFSLVFAVGGAADEFFNKHLAPYVDMSVRPWRYKNPNVANAMVGIDTASAGGAGLKPATSGPTLLGELLKLLAQSGPNLDAFYRAQQIRDLFFRDAGGKKLAWKIDLRVLELEPSITELVIDIDGQGQRYVHGPVQAFAVNWPGPRGGAMAEITANPRISNPTSTFLAHGPWALFRLLEKGRVVNTATPGRLSVEYAFDGRKALIDVSSGSQPNPLGSDVLKGFRCPGRAA